MGATMQRRIERLSGPSAAVRRAAAICVAAALGGGGGCTKDKGEDKGEAKRTRSQPEPVDARSPPDHSLDNRAGRMRLEIHTRPASMDPGPDLRFRAGFARWTGLSAPEAIRRAGLEGPPWLKLALGECLDEQALSGRSEPGISAGPALTIEVDGDARDLHLLDAGDLRLRVGDQELRPSLSLLPDLDEWSSGVEYRGGARLHTARPGPEQGGLPIELRSSGESEVALSAAVYAAQAPPTLSLEEGHWTAQGLELRWVPLPDPEELDSQTVGLQLQAFAGEDPVGRTIFCRAPDRGQVALVVSGLAGLVHSPATGSEPATALSLRATRLRSKTIEAPAFGPISLDLLSVDHVLLRPEF